MGATGDDQEGNDFDFDAHNVEMGDCAQSFFEPVRMVPIIQDDSTQEFLPYRITQFPQPFETIASKG